MNFTDQDIEEFINMWEKECGERLTEDQAHVEASNLVELARAMSLPLPHEPGYRADQYDDLPSFKRPMPPDQL